MKTRQWQCHGLWLLESDISLEENVNVSEFLFPVTERRDDFPTKTSVRLLRYLSIAESMEATNVLNPALNYGIVVDCGSSGSRVFVYYWPPHNGNPHTLLDIRQMRGRDYKPVVKKIKPGEEQVHRRWF